MNDWFNFLKFKNYDKWAFSVVIFIFITTTLLLLFLLNFLTNKYFFSTSQNVFNFTWRLLRGGENLKLWAPKIIMVAIFAAFLLWLLTVAIPLSYYYLIQKIASLSPLSRNIVFVPNKDLKNIVYQGNVSFRGANSFHVTNSEGVLLKHLYWRDFVARFDFDFKDLKPAYEILELKYLPEHPKSAAESVNHYQYIFRSDDNYVGFIFRALDLDNYFMISIGIKAKLKRVNSEIRFVKKLLITPHIRMNGHWEVFSSKEIPIKDAIEQNIIKEVGLNTNIVCRVEKTHLTLDIDNNEKIFEWELPTNFKANYGEGKELDAKYTFGDATRIPFRNNYGRIGFRAYGDEHVLVKNITITQL